MTKEEDINLNCTNILYVGSQLKENVYAQLQGKMNTLLEYMYTLCIDISTLKDKHLNTGHF